MKSEQFSNGTVERQLVKIEELHLSLVNIYRPPGSDISSFQEALDKVSSWLEEDRNELVMVGDFNLPEAGSWSEIETFHIRETAAKREGGLQGIKTKQMMLLLEFCEEHSLIQKVTEPIRSQHILDLYWTNTSCGRNCFVIHNVSLSDHNYVCLNYSITKLQDEDNEQKNIILQKSRNTTLKNLTVLAGQD